jgi:hypothetical protein
LQPIFLALIALTRHQKISTEGKVAGTVSVLFDDSIKAVLGDRFSLYSTQLRKSMSPFFKIYTSCLDDITKRAAPALALPGRVPSHGGGVGAGTSPLPYAPPPHFSPSSYPIPITVVETIVLDHTGAVVSSSRVSTPGGMLMASGGLPTAFATAIPDADLESSRVTTRVTVVPTTATRVPSAPPMVATPTGPSPKVGSGAGGPAKREGAPVPPPAKRGAGDEFKRDAATRGGGSTVAIKEVEPEDQVTVISHAEQLSEAALKYNRATTGVTSALDRGVNPEFFLKTQAESVREITMLVGQLFQEKFEPAAVLRVINLNKELMANLIVNLGEIAGSIESDQVLQCMEIMETTCKSLFPRKYDHLFPPK